MNKQKSRITIILISMLLFPYFYLDASGLGGINGIQQRINIDARFMGLGGAYDSISCDSSSIYYNPGGLTYIIRPVLFASYMPVWDNLTQIFFIGGAFQTKYFPLGFGVMNLNSGGIKVRTDSPEVKSFIEYRDISLFASSSYQIMSSLSIGIRVGFYYLNILNYNDWGMGCDVSLLWHSKEPYAFTKNEFLKFIQPISYGVIFYNLLPPTIKLYKTSTSFPFMFKNSISYRFPVLWSFFNSELGMGLEMIPESKVSNFSFGTEFTLWKILYLRSGYSFGKNTFTIGSGVNMKNIIVDYAIMPLEADMNFYTLNCKIKF